MSESAKIGRGKRSPSRARYKAELRDQKNSRLRAARKKPKSHPLKGLARALRRWEMGISREKSKVLTDNNL